MTEIKIYAERDEASTAVGCDVLPITIIEAEGTVQAQATLVNNTKASVNVPELLLAAYSSTEGVLSLTAAAKDANELATLGAGESLTLTASLPAGAATTAKLFLVDSLATIKPLTPARALTVAE